MVKCIICEQRPSHEGGFCHICSDKLASQKRHSTDNEPKYFLTYHGHVVGFYPNGGGMLRPRLLQRNELRLPKSKTINLNAYCEGFSREQVKRFKACIMQLVNN